jgi:queuine/archaeosine tRNA-ribosyltransferase
MADIRRAIEADRYASFEKEFLKDYQSELSEQIITQGPSTKD